MRKAILVGLMLLGATGAQGQLTGLNHIWTVPGAAHTGNGVGTFISCTNSNAMGATIGVEFYGPAGAFVNSGSLSVASGATVIFGTGSAAGLSTDVIVGTGVMSKGRGEVKSTATKGVLCSAFLLDTVNATPSFGISLTIAKKTKQKGD